MNFANIDYAKCKKDAICIDSCPFGLFVEDEQQFPRMKDGAENFCILCGHCVAVCPHGALQVGNIHPQDCQLIDKAVTIDDKLVAHLFQTRRSIRRYKDRPVSHEKLAKLIDIVRWAPTAVNVQPVRWIMVTKSDLVHEMAGMAVDWMRTKEMLPAIVEAWKAGEDMVLRGAPHLVIAHASSKGFKPVVDCSIAVASLELAASAMGIGGCWAGMFMGAANEHLPLVELLALPEDHQVYGALMLGYPKYHYQRVPPRHEASVKWL